MSVEELLRRGHECKAAGDLAGAEAAYREADSQGDAEGAIMLGVVLRQRGDISGASGAFRRSESRGHPEAAGLLGSLLSDTGDIQGAQAAYERSVAAGGKLAGLNLGLMLAQHDREDEALPYLEAAEQDGYPEASWGVGRILENRGDLQGARAAYGRGADSGDADAAFGLGRVCEKLGDRAAALEAIQRASDLGDDRASQFLAEMNSEAEASARIAPLAPGEERLLQTVHRSDGNRNEIYVVHRRPSDPETMGGEPVNFVAIVRATDDPAGSSPPLAWQKGATELQVCQQAAEAFVDSGTFSGTTVTLEPDLQWLVDRIREQRGPGVSPGEATSRWAELYAAACDEVMSSANACLEVANRWIGARDTANQRPQHEISIRHFTTVAEQAEAEFTPLYEVFNGACVSARAAATELLGADSDVAAEMKVAMAYEGDALGRIATAKAILGATFGPTPQQFLQGVDQANALIQNPEHSGNIYRAPTTPAAGPAGPTGGLAAAELAPTDQAGTRECPWCAETIKAAAVICRFCGRDVNMQANAG